MSEGLSIVIPTYGRDEVLTDTLTQLASLDDVAEIVIVDQTKTHNEATIERLAELESSGRVKRLFQERPSIPVAMNTGLLAATSEVVLFLDDDIEPDENLASAHLAAHHANRDASAVVGQVLQPEEESAARNGWSPTPGFHKDLDFPFWSNEPAWVSNVMAGNLSVKRSAALAAGAFDENFDGVAYRFETEFARRLIRESGPIYFEPRASIRHLRASRGGTRSTGSHMTSASPKHGSGDYYFAMRSGVTPQTLWHIAKRPFREVRTKFHLTHPWYIPIKLIGEVRAFGDAVTKCVRGPRLRSVAPDHAV